MPRIAAQCSRLAKQAAKERQPYIGYLEALLREELEERERDVVQRRIRDAHLPRLKTLKTSTSCSRRKCRRRSCISKSQLGHRVTTVGQLTNGGHRLNCGYRVLFFVASMTGSPPPDLMASFTAPSI